MNPAPHHSAGLFLCFTFDSADSLCYNKVAIPQAVQPDVRHIARIPDKIYCGYAVIKAGIITEK